MDDKQKIEVLRKCFMDVVWMSIRYAHGRNTYAPDMVRDAVEQFRLVFPEWKPKMDIVVSKQKESGSSDLNDLFT